MFLNSCTNFGPTLHTPSKCETALDFIVIGLGVLTSDALNENQTLITTANIVYYASHCDGTESKKHKRRKKNDPIYDLKTQDDPY
ncbi:hypothetical protein [Leptospira noguchii]|uniref:hypothetical protein n=1 Tax=Leptospira noguchii TaxID=28182 RepID=UPI0039F1FE04